MADSLISLPESFKSICKPYPVPTYSNQGHDDSSILGLYPSDLKQKIHLLNNNLALSWSGSSDAAKSLLQELVIQNESHGDVFQVIDKFAEDLRNKDIDLQLNLLSLDGASLTLGNWSMKSDSFHPLENVNYGGSGGCEIVDLLERMSSDFKKIYPISVGTNSDNAFYHVLSTFFTTFSSNYISGWGLKSSWGGPLEFLYANGAALEKLDDYLIVFWEATHESNTSVRFGFWKRIIKVKYIGDLMVLRIVEFGGSGAGSEKYHVVEPLISLSERPNSISTKDIPWISRRVFHFIRINNHPSLTATGFLSNWEEFTKYCSIQGSGNNVGFTFNSDFPKKILKEIGYKNLNSFELLNK
jgi:hypothetical protein